MNPILEGPVYLDEEQTYARFEPETPFLDTRFSTEAWVERESAETASADREQQAWTEVETPFLAEYHDEAPVNLEALQLEETLMELFDRDFNEAVSSLALEAAAQAEHFGRGVTEQETTALLTEWLDPLRRATEQMIERASESVGQQSLETLGEEEFDSLLESAAPAPGMVAPEFEEFLGKVWNKLKRVAGAAVKLAKKGAARWPRWRCRSSRC